MKLDDNIIFFGTKDLKKVHDFYGELLGLSIYMEKDVCRLYHLPGGGKLGFCSHMEFAGTKLLITLVTDDVDEIYDLFRKNGIECDAAPRVNQRFNLYHFFATDYDGYKVEIQKFL
ncbi:MAG: VOC family protein [Clostridiales bacterium]|nr:VOC family protein [Clostridiales bacterium]